MDDNRDPVLHAAPTVFIGKWTVKIMYLLKERPHRHGELRRSLRGISQRMLTKTLRNLESGGLITRRVANSKPLAVEYALTKVGRTFLAPLGSICRWAERHNTDLTAAIRVLEVGENRSAADREPGNAAR